MGKSLPLVAQPLTSTKRWRFISWAASVFSILFFSLFITLQVIAQPTGYQEYYVLGYEEHIWRAFRSIYEGPADDIPGQICSTVSLVATADYQILYYDHWEDGYEANLLQPIQATTRVYGDGDASNGGTGEDILRAGDELNLTSDQDLSGPGALNGFVPVDPTRNPAYLRYDGGDRILSGGGPIDLMHAMWPLDSTWIGGAWEIYSRQAQDDVYSHRLPIGEDLYDFGGGNYGTYGDFRNVYLQLGAFEDNTIVLIDNGAEVINLTLDRGETYSSQGYLNSSAAPAVTIQSGTVIRSNKPTQVGLVTGADSPAVGPDQGFQSRFFIVLSDQLWGADYVVPVPSGPPLDRADVYLSNPNDFSITVDAYDALGQTTFVISPSNYISSTVSYSQTRGAGVPQDSAVRFTSSDGVFGVLVTGDTSDVNFDWGFSGVPAKYLTRDYYVSWAPGSSNIPPTENGSPVWVTPLADFTTFYVDYSPLDGVVDETFTLDVLEQRRIFDPDDDNTGMHVWATGEFAVAWGEDPHTADLSVPYLDLGVATLPLLQGWLDPVLTLEKEAEPPILPPTGGRVTFSLVAQSYGSRVYNVNFTDTLPVNWTYVPESTVITFPSGSSGSRAPIVEGQILYWDLGADLDLYQSLTLTFQAEITSTSGITTSINRAQVVGREEYSNALFSATDDTRIHISTLDLVKSVSNVRAGIGDTLVYTLSYANMGTLTATNVTLYDTVPIQHVTFQSASHSGVYYPTSGAIVWSLGTLAPGASGTVSFAVEVNSFVQDGTVIENAGLILSDQTQGRSNRVHTTVQAPKVSVSKTGPPDVAPGQVLTYTIFYENVGGAQAEGVQISDTIPLSTTYMAGSLAIDQGDGWVSLSDAVDEDPGAYVTPTVVVEPGTVAAGETGQIRFSVRVDPALPAGSLVLNSASLDRALDIPRDSNIVVTYVSDLLLEKEAAQTVVAPGDVISYTLTYENVSQVTSHNDVYVREPIPDHTRLIAGSAQGGDSIEYSWDQGATWSATLPVTPVTHIRWYDAQVLAGAQTSVDFAVRVNTSLPPGTIIQNTAHITSAQIGTYFDEWLPSNPVDIDTVDLWVEKKAHRSTAQPGDLISYTVSVGNRGTVDLFGIQVRDRLPLSTTYQTGSIYGPAADDSGLPLLTWEVMTATAGGNAQTMGYVVALDADLSAGTQVTNTAVASSTLGIIKSDPVTVTITMPDVWVSPPALTETLDADERITRTLSIGNAGNLDLDWSLSENPQVPWLSQIPTEGSVLPLGSQTVSVTFDATGLVGASYTTTLRIDSDDPDEPYVDVPITLTVLAPNIVMHPAVLTATLNAGDVTTRTLTVGNEGNQDLNWSVTEVPPAAWLDQVPVAGTVASTSSERVTVTFDATGLGVGAVYTTSLQIVSNDPYQPQITVPVTLTIGQPLLTLTKQASSASVARGERFTYTLHITNSGLAAYGLVVSDVVPDHTTFAGCGGPPCALMDGAVVWNGLDLEGRGTTLDLTLVVTASKDLTNGQPLVNADYRLVADNAPLLKGPPVTTTASVAILKLAKRVSRDEIYAGLPLEYTLQIDNIGGSATQLVVSDTLPPHVTFGGCDCVVAGLATGPDFVQESGFCGAPFTCGLEGDQVVWRVDKVDSNRILHLSFWVTASESLSEGTLIVNEDYAAVAKYLTPLVGRVPVTTTVRELVVSVSKTAGPDPVKWGQQLSFTITVRNDGSLLSGVTVTDRLPSGLSYVTCKPQPFCEYSEDEDREVRWWVSTLPANSERVLVARASVDEVTSDVIVNASYGVWVPEARRRVLGAPVSVRVMHQIYLPIVLSNF